MKKVFAIIFFLSIPVFVHATTPDSVLSIIPKPVQVIKGKGFTNIDSQWKIYVPDVTLSGEAEYLNNYFKTNFDFKLPVLNSIPKGKNFILLKKVKDDTKTGGQYHLSIRQNKITVAASEGTGLYYGLETLLQLLPLENNKAISLPQLEIEDYPRFKWRGMHLDVCRHFFPKEDIKKYIDHLASYKMNVFHWHLTDDQGWRIEIKKYPALTSVGAWRNGSMIGPYADQKFDTIRYGGFYSQDDIREIVSYAEKRHVTIVPEIEMPGHCMAALAAYPQFSCTGGPFEVGKIWGVYNDVFCPKEETFKFLEDILSEVCELFPGKYIHIGGDEVPKTQWRKCEHCQNLIRTKGLKNEAELQGYFTTRIEKFLNSKGKQIIGWNEILEGGFTGDAAIMSWQGDKGGIAAAKQKHFAVMTPGDYCYFDHYQSESRKEPLAFGGYTSLEKVYSYEPTPKELSNEEKKFILGAQGNLWTEYIPDFAQVEYMIFPRLCALSEVLWSQKEENRNYMDFVKRLEKHFAWFEKNSINYSKALFDIKIHVDSTEENRGLHISFDVIHDEAEEIHYTIDGTDPRADLPVIDPDFKIYYPATVKAALFNNGKMKGRTAEQKFNINKATGKKISLVMPPSEKYNIGGAFTLVNGITGDLPWRGSDWLGFSGDNLVAVIDFGKTETYSKIIIDVLQDTTSWIYLPKSAEAFSSDDGTNFKSLGKISSGDIMQMKRQLTFNTGNSQSRFIKIIAENKGIIPLGSHGENNPAWLFADEIIVE